MDMTTGQRPSYLFAFQLCGDAKQYVHYGLVYNNFIHTSGVFYEESAHICFTGDGMIPMSQGHKVWVKCTAGSEANTALYEKTHRWNTFLGCSFILEEVFTDLESE